MAQPHLQDLVVEDTRVEEDVVAGEDAEVEELVLDAEVEDLVLELDAAEEDQIADGAALLLTNSPPKILVLVLGIDLTTIPPKILVLVLGIDLTTIPLHSLHQTAFSKKSHFLSQLHE